jgi:hypothetical protein
MGRASAGGRRQAPGTAAGAGSPPPAIPPKTLLQREANTPHPPFLPLHPQVHIVEARSSVLHYLTNLCAIVGGVFAVSGLLDSWIFGTTAMIRRKVRMGKFS